MATKRRSRSKALIRLPRNMRPKPLAGGAVAYFFELPPYARPKVVGKGKDRRRVPAVRHDKPCPVDSQALGTNLAAAIGKADQLNATLEEWRIGTEPAPTEGTVQWLFAWYRTKDRFKEAAAQTRRDYRRAMDSLEAVKLKTTTFGKLEVAKVKSDHADALYKHFLPLVGKRQAALRMQVARRAWYEWLRDHEGANPFARMGLDMEAEQGNRPTSREEYDRFRTAAREMGMQSMATAAALSFELIRRVSDVFGYVDPADEEEGAEPGGIYWEDYRPGVSITLRQHKLRRRGKAKSTQVIPLRGEPEPDADDQEIRETGRLLFPELEAELARTPRGEPDSIVDGKPVTLIVLRDDDRRRYTNRTASDAFHKVRVAAGLPEGMTPTGFRHGGATELGDAIVEAGGKDPDLRPMTGHATKEMVKIYDKVTKAKARTLATTRRQMVDAALAATQRAPDEAKGDA
jgi:hypothetical protein